MNNKNYTIQKPGQPIKASTINRPVQDLAKFLRMRVGAGLRLQWVGGIPILSSTAAPPPPQPVRLIAALGGGKYTWQGLTGATGGTWVDHTGVSDHGTDYAYEYNANNSLAAGTRVDLEQDPETDEWRFQFDTC